MIEPGANGRNLPLAGVWVVVGIALLVAAWLLPINMKSLTPPLLNAAGRGTPTVAQFGRQMLDSEKLGPAQLILSAARLVHDPEAPALEREVQSVAARRPEWVAWGGWDPFLDPLFNLKENTGRKDSTPVLTFFITEKARRGLQTFLNGSRSLGVQSMLQTREIQGTTRFIPATRPGGQSLDAVVLLTALLYQGEHLSAPLQRELRSLAETAVAQKQMGSLEMFYLDLLSLGQRLNWIQLCELMRTTASTKTVGEYAHLARLASDNLAVIYTAGLFSDSADKVATYLITFGKTGLEDLRLALGNGQGAVRQLLLQQVPVNRQAAPAMSDAVAELTLGYPRLALIVKYLGFLLGAFCVFRGLQGGLIGRTPGSSPFRMGSAVLAVLVASIMVLATEPYLLKAAPPSEFKFKVTILNLASISNDAKPPAPVKSPAMDKTTLASIAFFASLQIIMYLVCLMKIREVSRQPVSPLVKLRLMENEENLFDVGLYIGIGGTATALVLQVLGLIQPNLLAAYSSNLFGITCVALVKIRHVRPYKRQLILDSQATPGNLPSAPSTAIPGPRVPPAQASVSNAS
jgi:hypothetical protein